MTAQIRQGLPLLISLRDMEAGSQEPEGRMAAGYNESKILVSEGIAV
jgi:hypothetical protein